MEKKHTHTLHCFLHTCLHKNDSIFECAENKHTSASTFDDILITWAIWYYIWLIIECFTPYRQYFGRITAAIFYKYMHYISIWLYYLTRNIIPYLMIITVLFVYPVNVHWEQILKIYAKKFEKMNLLNRKSFFFWSDSNTHTFLNIIHWQYMKPFRSTFCAIFKTFISCCIVSFCTIFLNPFVLSRWPWFAIMTAIGETYLLW